MKKKTCTLQTLHLKNSPCLQNVGTRQILYPLTADSFSKRSVKVYIYIRGLHLYVDVKLPFFVKYVHP